MNRNPFKTGIEMLVSEKISLLRGRRLGLLSHAAGIDYLGRSSAQMLLEAGLQLKLLFCPEHGFFGQATAGESVRTQKHPSWNIPIVSLYGARKRPPPSILRKIEVLVFDLQDLAVRTYTYVSTLLEVLHAAARAGVQVIVADRPIPFGKTVDGPMLDPEFKSFVGAIEAPFVYGMTPAETAIWLRPSLPASADVVAAPMEGWKRDSFPPDPFRPWVPPSPGIRSRESALCYPATVFGEAVPSVDIGRGTLLPFQLIAAGWISSKKMMQAVERAHLPGVRFSPFAYRSCFGTYEGRIMDGIRMVVTDPSAFKPLLTSTSLISILQETRGIKRFWNDPAINVDFFDKLMGTDTLRIALMKGEDPHIIAKAWKASIDSFLLQRRKVLLY